MADHRTQGPGKSLNILTLYNDRWTHIESTREHLAAFANRSRHNYRFLPASEMATPEDVGRQTFEDYRKNWPQAWDFSLYDAVIWHFVLPAYKSAKGWASDFLAAAIMEKLAAYDGLKVLFVQDEYDSTSTIWNSIRSAGINLVMTCVPPQSVAYVYPPQEVPGVEFIQTLTGFAPDDRSLERFAAPMADRRVRIAYRGRALPFRYGNLGREKYEIGVRMRALAEARGVPVDIDWTEESRIYGDDWYRFLGSARAMLATESGSNVFDFSGALHAAEETSDGLSYEDFHARHLARLEGKVAMNQISPKVFEAIGLRTALVCFKGDYSGVIRPDEHFIALKKDFSNADAVFARLEDLDGLKAMTDRAYRDVIDSGRYGYRAFVAQFDDIVAARVKDGPRAEIISAPILVRRVGEDRPTPIVRPTPFEYALNDTVLSGDYRRRQLEADMAKVREAESTPYRSAAAKPPADAVSLFHASADAVRCYDVWKNVGATLELRAAGALVRTPPTAWHYAAGVHLDFSAARPDHQHLWVRLVVGQVKGDLRAGLYDGETDTLSSEVRVPEGAGPHVLYLRAADTKGNLLVLRTGAEEAAAEGVVIDADILSASAYNPSFLALARRLAYLPEAERPW